MRTSFKVRSGVQKSKYEKWYDELCDKARNRDIPTCYTEVHHIRPRSLGGSDDKSNLVRLSYREHYIAHWLLTKFHTGINLAKMQRALWAMTLSASGVRSTVGWQFEAAKRAIRDIELNEAVDEGWLERHRQKQQVKKEAHRAAYEEWQRQKDQDKLDDNIRIEHLSSPKLIELLEKDPAYIARRELIRANPKLLKRRRIPLSNWFRNVPPPS